MIGSALRKAKSYWAAPLFMKLWLLPTWVLLGVARITVLYAPFRSVAMYLGEDCGTASAIPLVTQEQLSIALLVGRTVRLGARYAPWTANCFPQAVVAALILRIHKVPYSIFFGLRKQTPPLAGMDAHAWIMSGRVAVTGGQSFEDFTVVGAFNRWN